MKEKDCLSTKVIVHEAVFELKIKWYLVLKRIVFLGFALHRNP